MRTHAAKKPYNGQLHQESFTEGSYFKVHLIKGRPTGEKSCNCVVCNKEVTHIGDLMEHRRTHATDKQSTCNKSCANSSSSAKQFKLKRGIKTQDLKMKSDSVSTLSLEAKPFLEKSFGCGLCGGMLGIEQEFLEHCSGHRFSPPDDICMAVY